MPNAATWSGLAGIVAIVAGCAELRGCAYGRTFGSECNSPFLLPLALMLLGAGLAFCQSLASMWGARGMRCACAVALVGIAAFSTVHPGSMPISFTFNVAMLGMALLLINVQRRGVSFAQMLAIPVLAGSLLTLVECLYGTATRTYTHDMLVTDIHDVCVFMMIAAGILLVHRQQQPMATWLSNGIGGFLVRRVQPAVLVILVAGGWLRIVGEKAGLYETEIGTALVVTFVASGTAIMFWCAARKIDRLDAARAQTKEALRRLNAELERRVAERTADLKAANRDLANEIEAGNLARAELHANEQSYRFLFESNPVPLCVFDHETLRYTEVNHALLQQYGYSLAEFIGMEVDRILPPGEMARMQDYLNTIPSGQNYAGRWRNLKKDGSPIDVEVFHHVVQIDGRPHSIALSIDVTERCKAEEALQNYAGRLQILSQQLLNVQETERCRIARELHDHIGQTLTAVKLGVQSIRRALKDETAAARLEDTIQLTAQVLEQVRSLSLDLRPPLLDELGLVAALDSHIRKHASRGGLKVHFDAKSLPVRPPSVVATACFRVVQEGLTNVMRHAEANSVWISLKLEDGALRVRVTDDGRGYDPEIMRQQALKGKSIGLLSMMERATLIGGWCEIVSSPGTGTSVRASFPLDQAIDPCSNGEMA